MKSTIKVYNLNKQSDISKINRAISVIDGIIACEISLERKEMQVVYNEAIVTLDEIIASVEDMGYMVM